MSKTRMLDTQPLVWLVTGDSRLPQSLREDIEYFQHRYMVSMLSWMELSRLIKHKKLRGVGLDLAAAMSKASELGIETDVFGGANLTVLDRLPMLTVGGKLHADPFDRGIIAQAITMGATLISSDLKFPSYRKYGLDLIEV
ncbi:MAG: type II toxin-antitoxin system VapC family toxin [Bacteroidales bacterium]|nr:type II toxin-antitoxin system VapC family toxin [Bacteroidales bacterium]